MGKAMRGKILRVNQIKNPTKIKANKLLKISSSNIWSKDSPENTRIPVRNLNLKKQKQFKSISENLKEKITSFPKLPYKSHNNPT